MLMPTPAALFGSILFGILGISVFRYGKKIGSWKKLVIGLGLMGYTFAISDTRLIYAVGFALTACLFVFRD